MVVLAVVALAAGCGEDDDDGAAATVAPATTEAAPSTSDAPTTTRGVTTSTAPTTTATTAPAATTTTTAAVAPTTTAAPAPVTLDAATRATLDTTMQAAFTDSGLPGVAASIWIGDQRWDSVLGVRDTTTQEPYRADDHVRIASITKSFTATAVLQLVDAGALSLDNTLEPFVPGITNGDVITVRQLLGMQSGIFDFTSDPGFTARFDADPTLAWTPDDVLAIVNANPPAFAPGAQTQYCDTNYVLLGLIIEAVTGRPAGEVIVEQVVEPLGLASTVFPTDPTVPEPHPTAYVPDPDDPSTPPKVVNDVNPAVAWTAGAMISSLEDLRVWGEELASGSLLSPELQRERLTSNRFSPTGINFGYGLGVERLNDIVGHNGAIYGYSTVVFRYPEVDMTVVVVSNSSTNFTTPTSEIALKLIQQLYPAQIA